MPSVQTRCADVSTSLGRLRLGGRTEDEQMASSDTTPRSSALSGDKGWCWCSPTVFSLPLDSARKKLRNIYATPRNTSFFASLGMSFFPPRAGRKKKDSKGTRKVHNGTRLRCSCLFKYRLFFFGVARWRRLREGPRQPRIFDVESQGIAGEGITEEGKKRGWPRHDDRGQCRQG